MMELNMFAVLAFVQGFNESLITSSKCIHQSTVVGYVRKNYHKILGASKSYKLKYNMTYEFR